MALSGVQVVLDDQAAGHRAAHQGAGDQAEGGGRQSGHVGAGRSAGLYQLRTVGRGSGGAADQSGGADADADEGVLTKGQHDAAAQSILDGDHDNGQNQDQNHGLAAAEQSGDADGEADGGEEQVLEHRLQGAVKGDAGHAADGQDAVDDREQQAAHQGSGDTIAVQDAHLVGDDAADPEQNSTKRYGMVHIKANFHHSDIYLLPISLLNCLDPIHKIA